VKFKEHNIANKKIAEISSNEIIIHSANDALDLLGNSYYQGFEYLILHEKNITDDFFDLKNGLAGEILQKFSNYRMSLAIVGDFEKYTKKSIRDFIYESNKAGRINFTATIPEALKKFTK